MTHDYYVPQAVDLPGRLRRESVRPAEYRDEAFDDQYDSTTLFYDAFWSGDRVLLMGPPLHDLALSMVDLTIVALPSGERCVGRVEELDLHMRLWVTAPTGTTRLSVEAALGTVEVEVRPSRTSDFRGLRVLQTMSKDNDLVWVEDWVRYHRDVHGADAVLLYDNLSTRYTAEELSDRLHALSGMNAVQVVSWPFPFGPQGFQGLGYWDANYSQLGGYDHARWLFLAEAEGVLNADIDELIVTPSGRRLFDLLRARRSGVLRYRGLWVAASREETPEAAAAPNAVDLRRHAEYGDVVRIRNEVRRGRLIRHDTCPSKWAADPRRCPETAQWHIHRIKGWAAALPVTRQVAYRHFWTLSTSWKYQREESVPFDPALHRRDDLLRTAYTQVDWSA
jgi:hypothetical protein